MEMGYFVGDSAIAAIGAASALYSLLMSLTISMNSAFAFTYYYFMTCKGIG